jgi:ABC-type transport system substrate-binding protein
MLGTAGSQAAVSRHTQEGGALTIGISTFDFIDPALTWPPNSGGPISTRFLSVATADATCALLFRYPVAPPPHIRYDLVPEVATGYPAVAPDGRTYTFTIRKGYRFSTGAPVTAASYAAAINRDLSPSLQSPAVDYLREVVGADAVQQGAASTASGIKVAGNRLIVQLTRKVPDFPARMTMPYFCPVVPGLPLDPEGAGAPLPGSGPYYVSEFVRGTRAVLSRNTFYGGSRAHHLDRIVIDIGDDVATITRKVETGEQDLSLAVAIADAANLVAKYGVNKNRFFSIRSPTKYYVVMNTSRPLFQNNVKLRQAVSFALDRTALAGALGPTALSPSDAYLPPGLPGFRDGHAYPVHPDLAKAQALARGRTRSGTAVLYTCDNLSTVYACLSFAQIIHDDLKPIGIDVQIQQFPLPVQNVKLGTRTEPFDLTIMRYDAAWADPYQFVNVLLDGRMIAATGNTDQSYFNSPHYNRLIDKAGELSGQARYDAYGKLAVDIAVNAAPMAAVADRNSKFFVSSRVGCVTAGTHNVDLAGLCLK